MRGVVAGRLGYDYTGVDIRAEQVDANIKQYELFGGAGSPRWICGDSTELDQYIEGEYDLVFSCPPYADLEIYSKDPRDLSNMSYDDFIAGYRKAISSAVGHLRENCFAVWVVGDVRDKKGKFYRDFISDTIKAFTDAGAGLYNELILLTPVGSASIRAARGFTTTRNITRTHQYILVFYKGDPRKIKDNIEKIEVQALEEDADLI